MATSTVVTPDTTSPSAPYPPDPVSAYPPNPVSAYPPDPVSAYPLYPVSAYPLNPVSAYHPDPVLTTANPPPTNPTPDVCSGSAIAKVPDQKQTLPVSNLATIHYTSSGPCLYTHRLCLLMAAQSGCAATQQDATSG